jgi:transcriptional regulator with XRE-family HTH domain
MSYAKLRGKIREVFGTQYAFAAAMGVSSVTISQRLNGKVEWKTNEIAKACELLGISLEEVAQYFFDIGIKFS